MTRLIMKQFLWLLVCAAALPLSAAPDQESLLATMQSSAPLQEKWAAAHQLVQIATADAVPKLAVLLTNEQLVDLARYVLEPLPSPSVDRALRAALVTAKGRPLEGVITSIGMRGDAKAVHPLSRFLKDRDPEVARATVAALGRIGTASAAKAMERALPRASEKIQPQFWAGLVQCADTLRQRGQRAQGLSVFHWVVEAKAPARIHEAGVRGEILTGGKDEPRLLANYLQTDTATVLRLAQTELPGPTWTAVLVAGLLNLPADQQVLLTEALGQRGDDKAIAALIHAAAKGDKAVRLAAIRSVPHDASVVPALAGLISDPDQDIVQAACDRLESLPEKEADTAILNLFDSENPALRLAAAKMAGRRRLSSATVALIKAAASKDPGLADAALTALGETASETDAAALSNLLSNPAVDTNAVESILAAIGGRTQEQQAAKLEAYPFFPFCIDWHDAKKRGYPAQAAMLKELGYPGVGHIFLDGVAERLKSLDAANLQLFQITMKVDLSPGKPAFDPRFKDVLALVKGRHVQFDLLINGAVPSDVSTDAHAVQVLREMSDMARESGAQLLLYPHVGCWVERLEDAVRVADKVNRPNVGVMFNLCHWLRVDKQRDYKPILAKAMPRLWAVSICGADDFDPAPGWAHYIQPLDQGSFDVGLLLKTLKQLGYKGPIGLQCYGIGGDAHNHLARSMAAWQKLKSNLESPQLPIGYARP